MLQHRQHFLANPENREVNQARQNAMTNSTKNTDVEEALDLLAEEVREEIQRIRNEGAVAMTKGDYATATSVIEFAGKLESFAGNVDKLVEEWNSISDQQEAEPEPVRAIVSKIFPNKARKGTITSHEELYIPLLQALVNLGGKAKTKDAIDEVGRLMEGKLKPRDFDFLKSGSDTIRWRNKVMWARNSLVNQLGLMKNNSPFGVWEISDKGRQSLSKQVGTAAFANTSKPEQVPAIEHSKRPPVSFTQQPGHKKEPQSNFSVVIRWDLIGKGTPERIRLHTAAATLVQTLYRLSSVLGGDTLTKMSQFRVSRGPVISSEPDRDFVNQVSGETYSHQPFPGTRFFVRTHSSTDEKIKELKSVLVYLRQPSALLEIQKHLKS